jgi:predicted dehydrogenase
MIKIGVLGAGHLGKIHIKLIKELSETFDLAGIHDIDEERGRKVASEFDTRYYSSADELVSDCEAIDIVTPTVNHFSCAQLALRSFKHIFIEKPVTQTLEEARSIQQLAREAGMVVQIGHVERFNPSFCAVAHLLNKPMFIETHRLAQFNPRGTDVSVVLDLMIHDIDIVLSVVDSNIRRIDASGVSIVSDTPDIANARIAFDNGCVANLTASRISMKNMRKIRFFQRDAYLSVDFLEKQAEVVSMTESVGEPDPYALVLDMGVKGKRIIDIQKTDVQPVNAIMEELKDFATAIKDGRKPKVSLEDGIRALDVALKIMDKLGGSTQITD